MVTIPIRGSQCEPVRFVPSRVLTEALNFNPLCFDRGTRGFSSTIIRSTATRFSSQEGERMFDKKFLFNEGVRRAKTWCNDSGFWCPPIHSVADITRIGMTLNRPGVCLRNPSNRDRRKIWEAYSLKFNGDSIIIINPVGCSDMEEKESWSYPGAITDRSPYGTVLHHLGIYLLKLKGDRWTNEVIGQYRPISSSLQGDSRGRFYEAFRLFVSNPALLKELRPDTYESFLKKVPPKSATETDRLHLCSWEHLLLGIPKQGLIASIKRKITREKTACQPELLKRIRERRQSLDM